MNCLFLVKWRILPHNPSQKHLPTIAHFCKLVDARIYENKCGTLDFLLSYMLSYIWICFQEILTGVHLEIILKVNHQWVGNWILQVSLPRDRVMHSITYFHIFLMKKFLSGRRYVKFLLSWHTTLCLFDKFTKSIWFHSTVMQ